MRRRVTLRFRPALHTMRAGEQGDFVEGQTLAAGGFGGQAPASALFGEFEGAQLAVAALHLLPSPRHLGLGRGDRFATGRAASVSPGGRTRRSRCRLRPERCARSPVPRRFPPPARAVPTRGDRARAAPRRGRAAPRRDASGAAGSASRAYRTSCEPWSAGAPDRIRASVAYDSASVLRSSFAWPRNASSLG